MRPPIHFHIVKCTNAEHIEQCFRYVIQKSPFFGWCFSWPLQTNCTKWIGYFDRGKHVDGNLGRWSNPKGLWWWLFQPLLWEKIDVQCTFLYTENVSRKNDFLRSLYWCTYQQNESPLKLQCFSSLMEIYSIQLVVISGENRTTSTNYPKTGICIIYIYDSLEYRFFISWPSIQ